jgi:hypothetical protein
VDIFAIDKNYIYEIGVVDDENSLRSNEMYSSRVYDINKYTQIGKEQTISKRIKHK